jgi:peptidoglycan/LPS O-acetylase OafA/YrhL
MRLHHRETDPHVKYRPDIDGLRAFAILSVIGYHAFPTYIQGGFVGGDIFFVISGFLISKIIFTRLNKGDFSFSEFYVRRIQRIFPALIIVLLSCIVFGWFALLPEEIERLGKHVSAAVIFVSNFLLWSESGYFDVSASMKPLLHLWSLGIEEQFYAVAPLFFWGLYNSKTRLPLVLASLFAISFGLNLALINKYPVANFYFPFNRMFELLAGSLLALHHIKQLNANPKCDNIIAFFGVLLIVGSVFCISPKLGFPGYVVLVPLIGTVLLIHSGSNNLITKYLFANRLAVIVGLISYPLYLWHWPLLSFAKIFYGGDPPGKVRLVLVLIAFILAFIVYILIEKPFRTELVRHRIYVLSTAMLVIGVLGVTTYISNGETQYHIPKIYTEIYGGDLSDSVFAQESRASFFSCDNERFLTRVGQKNTLNKCVQSKKGQAISTVIVGDSHAEALFRGVAEKLIDHNVSYYVSGYAPIPENPGFAPFFKEIQSNKNIKIVIIAAYWITTKTHGVPEGSSFEKELTKTAELLLRSGKQVYMIVDNPVFSFPPEVCKYSRFPDHAVKCNMKRSDFDDQKVQYFQALLKIEAEYDNVRVLDPTGLFCDPLVCSMVKNGKVLYRDTNHLNIDGSKYVGSWIAAQIE